MNTVTTSMPLYVLGLTDDGRRVLGGAFEMADTLGFPLCCCMDAADLINCTISMPHYFASAMEHGWDDVRTFGKIAEALADRGKSGDLTQIKYGCMSMFMAVADTMSNARADEIGKQMRELLESGRIAFPPKV